MAVDRQQDTSLPLPADAEAAVRPLLARANLLRLRGQWDEAIALCTEALRLVPRSPSAHSLLGDIYDAQGRIDEALPWYGMAVDLDPTNTVDRAKFERVREIQRARLATLHPPPPPPAHKPATEKTLEWFDRIFPPGRTDSIARLIFVMCGGIALLLLVLAAVFYEVLPRPNGEHRAVEGAASSVGITTPLPALSNKPVVMLPSATPSTAPSSLPPSHSSPSPTQGANGSDLRSRLASQLPGVTVAAASRDERTSGVSLDIVLAGTSTQETVDRVRERVVRAAAQGSRAVAQVGNSVSHTVVRIFLPSGNSKDLSATSAPVFVGEAAPDAFRDVEASTSSALDLLTRFRSLQWGPPLNPAPETGTSTTTAASPSPPATSPTPVPIVNPTGGGG